MTTAGNSSWDICLTVIADRAGLTATEKCYFYLRFSERYRHFFQDSETIEQALEKINESQNIEPSFNSLRTNYKKHMSQVFRKIGLQLDIKYKNQNNKDPELFEEIKKYFDNFKKIIKISQLNPDEQFALLIQRLDYLQQKEEFQNDLDSHPFTIKSYFLKVDYDDENCLMQKMLIQRLCRSLPWVDIPIFYDIKVTDSWRDESCKKICEELSLKINLPAIYNFDELCLKLLELNKCRPIVISLRNAPKMRNQLPIFLQDFWTPLARKIIEKIDVSNNSGIILFLSGEKDISSSFCNSNIDYFKPLSPLEGVTRGDVKIWFSCEDVRMFRRDCLRRNRDLNFQILENQERVDLNENLGSDTYTAMEIISEVFGFSRDLEQFGKYWELNGDLIA